MSSVDEFNIDSAIEKWLGEDGRTELDKADELAKERLLKAQTIMEENDGIDPFNIMDESDKEYLDQEKDVGVIDLTRPIDPVITTSISSTPVIPNPPPNDEEKITRSGKKTIDMHMMKQQMERIKNNSILYDSTYPFYASNMPHVKKVFEDHKHEYTLPKWMIRNLVQFRDMSICRICNLFDERGVVNSLPGFKYDEPGCIFVCRECDRCWSRVINLSNQLTFEHKFLKFRLFMLKKRAMCVNNSDGIVNVTREELAAWQDRFEELNLQTKDHAKEMNKAKPMEYGEIFELMSETK